MTVTVLREELTKLLPEFKKQASQLHRASSVYYAVSSESVAHFPGLCLTRQDSEDYQWHQLADNETLVAHCSCVDFFYSVVDGTEPGKMVAVVEDALAGTFHQRGDPSFMLTVAQAYPLLFNVWYQLEDLLVKLILKDSAAYFSRPLLSLIGDSLYAPACTVQLTVPKPLRMFPDGSPVVLNVPVLPEEAVDKAAYWSPAQNVVAVDGWSKDRVATLSSLLSNFKTTQDTDDVFTLVTRLVP